MFMTHGESLGILGVTSRTGITPVIYKKGDKKDIAIKQRIKQTFQIHFIAKLP